MQSVVSAQAEPAPIIERRAAGRIPSLDSLRGVAAFIVLLHHLTMMVPSLPKVLRMPPFRLLLAGEAMVHVFFVLSGFVLYLTFTSVDRGSIRSFYIKRIFRIYPPFAVAMVLAFLVAWGAAQVGLVNPPAELFQSHWTHTPTLTLLAQHLAMPDLQAWQSLNNAIWSLVVEMRFSLVFPLIAWAVRGNSLIATILAVLISAFSVVVYQGAYQDLVFNPFSTLRYTIHFAAGALLAKHAVGLRISMGKLPPLASLGLWLLALGAASVNPLSAFGAPTTIGAILLVTLVFTSKRAQALLEQKVPLWLGKVSYSLYLIHIPVILLTFALLAGHLPFVAIAGVATIASLLVAAVLFDIVEKPSMRLGRKLAAHLG